MPSCTRVWLNAAGTAVVPPGATLEVRAESGAQGAASNGNPERRTAAPRSKSSLGVLGPKRSYTPADQASVEEIGTVKF